MTDRVTIGIVGCGRLAEVGYLPALARVPGARVVAVADPDPGRRARVARLVADGPGTGAVTAHHDLTELLDAGTPDALVIATPAGNHVADATIASQSGVPTLLEKPPAPDGAGAAAIAALERPPWIAFNRRFDPGAARVRADVDRHDALEFEFEFEITYRRQGWGSVQVHDDALLDLGPHLVDWARWIAGGDLDRVRGLEIRPDRAVVLARSPRGAVRLIARTDGTYRERIEVRARGGRLVARHRRGGTVDNIRGRLPGATHPLVATLAAELTEFAAVARGGSSDRLGTASDGLAVMQVVDATRASAAAGGAAIAPGTPSES